MRIGCHQPHRLRDGGFEGHVISLEKLEIIFHLLPDLINLHIGAFVHDLGCHDRKLAFFCPFLHLCIELIDELFRQSADAEGLNDDAVVIFKKIAEHLGTRAWNQLHDTDGIRNLPLEMNRCRNRFIRNIPDDPTIHDLRKHRKVYAVERVVGAGHHLLCTCPGDDIAIENKHYVHRIIITRIDDAVTKIHLCIGTIDVDRLLRACDHDRLSGILHHIAERRRGVGHRIRAMRDHEAIISIIIFLNCADDLRPDSRRHIGRVNVTELENIDIAVRFHLRNKSENLLRRESRSETILRLHGCDRTAG